MGGGAPGRYSRWATGRRPHTLRPWLERDAGRPREPQHPPVRVLRETPAEGMWSRMTGIDERANMTEQKRSRVQWLLALGVSALIFLPVELDRHHFASRSEGTRVFGALLAWLILGSFLRLLIYLVTRFSLAGLIRRVPTVTAEKWTIRYAVLALIAAVVVSGGIGLTLKAAGVHVAAGIGVLIADGCFLCTLLPLYRARRLQPSDVGLRRTVGSTGVGVVVLALVGYWLASAIWVVLVRPPRIQSNVAGIAHHSTAVIVLTGIALCVSAPVVEEIFFRGLLYRVLRNRLAVIPAATIDGVIFGIGHTQYPLLVRPELAFFGIIACLLYESTGSLLPGIALHSLVDATAFERALTGGGWIVPILFVALAVVLVTGSKIRRSRPLAV
jgi:membrane protease YdiL (CAAX protease family)